MTEKFEKLEKIEKTKVDGKIIHSPIDGPDGVLPDIKKPAPRNPDDWCGNNPTVPPLEKPAPSPPLDPRLKRQVKDSTQKE